MSSRFVSGGTISGEGSKDEAVAAAATAREPLAKKSVEWETVQHELDEERKRREHARAELAEGGQQSLYDILQANKAAKQAAFEEQNKLKNQFRALGDDGKKKVEGESAKEKLKEKEREPPKEEKKASLGLVAYDSDSDDDE